MHKMLNINEIFINGILEKIIIQINYFVKHVFIFTLSYI